MKKPETVAQVALRMVDDPATRSLAEVRKAVAARREEMREGDARRHREMRERQRSCVMLNDMTGSAS